MLILDTDVLSLLEWSSASPKAKQLSERLGLLQEKVVTTIVCVEEQMRGWLSSLSKKKMLTEQVKAYARLRQQVNNLRLVDLLDFDELAATKFQELKKAKLRVGTMDLKIAAIALVHAGTVVTGNLSDYHRVPDLQIRHWEKL